MPKAPKISEAEWEVMKLVWETHPITATDLTLALATTRKWSPQTVKTLLSRLTKKGALKHQQQGKTFLYKPAIPMSQCIKEEGRTFVEKVFGGAVSSMLLHFVENTELDADEIKQLRKILAERETRTKK